MSTLILGNFILEGGMKVGVDYSLFGNLRVNREESGGGQFSSIFGNIRVKKGNAEVNNSILGTLGLE